MMTRVKQYKLLDRRTGNWLHRTWEIHDSAGYQFMKDPNGAYRGTRKEGKAILRDMCQAGLPKERLDFITFFRVR